MPQDDKHTKDAARQPQNTPPVEDNAPLADDGSLPDFSLPEAMEPQAKLVLPADDAPYIPPPSQWVVPKTQLGDTQELPPLPLQKKSGGLDSPTMDLTGMLPGDPSPTTDLSELSIEQEPAAPRQVPVGRRRVFTFGRKNAQPQADDTHFDPHDLPSEATLMDVAGQSGQDAAAPAPAAADPAPAKAKAKARPQPAAGKTRKPFWEEFELRANKNHQPPPSDGSPFAPRKRERNAFASLGLTVLRLLVVVGIIGAFAGAGAGIGIAKAYMDTTPALNLDELQEQDLSSFIYDANGNMVTTLAGMENRIYAPIDEIPDMLQKAVIAIEDNRFESHDGVDIKRIVGAFFNNLRSSSVHGGSTITQQLIKLKVLSPERTYKRKIQEAWLALQLETQYEKPQILEAYLNSINLGQSNYGVKAAAQDYFGKELSQLSLRECAMLAGIAQTPYTYDPRANTYIRNRMDLTNRRTDTVLMRMYENGYINQEEYRAALEDDVFIIEKSEYKDMYDMPYFVEFAMQDVVQGFLKSRGLENTAANRQEIQNELRTGGYRINTTVDPQIQQMVEQTLYTWENYPSTRYSQDRYTIENTSDSSFIRIEQPQAAAVVLDYRAGQYKAIVGGRVQPTTRLTQHRAYQSHMPVGSSIKPLAVYGPALDMGLSPATPMLNAPVAIEGWGTERGYPNNYGGGGFTGLISLREAVKKSLNIVAARTLMEDVSVSASTEYMRKLGVTEGLNEDGPGLALGTSGVSVVEMAAAYGAIGNLGEYIQPYSFTTVTDSNGRVILDADDLRERQQVYKPATAYILGDILEEAVQGGTGTRAKISGMTVAGKTGTNSDNRGVTFGGLTPYYSAFVWVGHDRYKELAGNATGSTAAAPLWQAFMARIHEGLPNAPLFDTTAQALGITTETVCAVSGKIATEACQLDAGGFKPYTDMFAPGTAPYDICDMHHVLKLCDVSGKIATEYCPQDAITEQAIIAIPATSRLSQLSPEDMARYFPGAVNDYPTGDALQEFTPDNPEYADSFCPNHTKEWHDQQDALAASKAAATAAINQIRLAADAADWLSDNDRTQLGRNISAVQTLMNDADITAAQIDQAVTALKSYANSLLTPPA